MNPTTTIRTRISRAMAGVIVLNLAVTISGCSLLASPPPVAIGLVIDSSANTLQADPAVIQQLAAPAISDQSQVVIVESDGSPSVLFERTMPDEGQTTVIGWNAEVADAEEVVAGAVLDAVPTEPETAPLEAIGLTARFLDPALERKIHYVGSGLQTGGSMPMSDGRLYHEPADVLEYLRDTEQLPVLTGITVHMHGLGAVAGAQSPLDLPAQKRLEELWRTVLLGAGADDVQFHTLALDMQPAASLPPVSSVEIRFAGALPPLALECERIELGDARLSFVSDTADYIDGPTAAGIVAEVAAVLADCPGPFVVLGGTSSAGSEEGRRSLAQARSERVADDLARVSGIDRELFATVAAATEHCGFRPDRDDRGALIPEIAAQNRVVVVFAVPDPDIECQ